MRAEFIEFPVYVLVRSFVLILNTLPAAARIWIVSFFIHLYITVFQRYKRICHKNIALVFPEKSHGERSKLIRSNCTMLARTVVDALRMGSIDSAWIEEHVDTTVLDQFWEKRRGNPALPILWVTGHLGSFELQARIGALLGHPLSFVVRRFKMRHLDRWWNEVRESSGNMIIDRKGGVKEILKILRSGGDVGILFDQNVVLKHAVFVEWFGRPAATTKTVALAALKCRPMVVVTALVYKGAGRYQMKAVEVELSDIHDDPALNLHQKITRITRRCVEVFEQLIKEHPESWFWMHRRWKRSSHSDNQEDFYR